MIKQNKMNTKQEKLEELAKEFYSDENQIMERIAFKRGYTECEERMSIELEQLRTYPQEIRLIKTKKDYQLALTRLELIFDSKKGTSEYYELEILGILIEKYENEHFPIELTKMKHTKQEKQWRLF